MTWYAIMLVLVNIKICYNLQKNVTFNVYILKIPVHQAMNPDMMSLQHIHYQ